MFVEIDPCPPHMQAQACKMFGDDKTCHYVQICDSTSGSTGRDEAQCDRVHKWGEVGFTVFMKPLSVIWLNNCQIGCSYWKRCYPALVL